MLYNIFIYEKKISYPEQNSPILCKKNCYIGIECLNILAIISYIYLFFRRRKYCLSHINLDTSIYPDILPSTHISEPYFSSIHINSF